eukprot:Phypoly_transcript_03454.p1 GENE.Phypoly_transcript_03454~~Phypoly_transcript_03454.p1  ORF type:complete len:716 (+),score=120.56 Phypoly_transcript_03454:143-2290(+)
MDPIHYGSIVGLSHPGNYARIVRDKGKDFVQFRVEGGPEGTVVANGGIISLAQNPPDQYSLLSSDIQWKATIQRSPFGKDGPLHSGARIKLDDVNGIHEFQLYEFHRLQIDPIEHVVLLMMENRSFFRVFGYLDPNRDNYVNYSESGKEFRSAPSDDLDTPDPPHEISYVNISLEGEKHDGYVRAYEKYHKVVGDKITDADLLDIMGYTRKGFLPALHKMEQFASICSQWYSSLRGPTWPNRMYALSGTCFNWRTTPEMNAELLTNLKDLLTDWLAFKPVPPQRFSIFDILQEKNIRYGIYTDTPMEFTLSADVFYPACRDANMNEFRKHAKNGNLPQFSFMEPNFVHMPDFGFIQNDDHPPANPLKAQKFIAEVYETLRTSPKWNKTLFIVTYDEHGGFFDPVIPPPAPIPDLVSTDEQKTFGKFGVRVPTVLVSPCIKHGIDDTVYDHTSVLKYVLQKWVPEGVNWLGERVKYANSLPVLSVPRTDEFPPITEEDFRPLKEHRAANNKHDDEVHGLQRLSLHETAARALKDPEIEKRLRSVIVAKRVQKLTKRSNYEKSTAALTQKISQVEKQQEVERQKEHDKNHHDTPLEHIGEAISHAFSHIFKPKAQCPPHVSRAPKLAAEIVDEAARADAQRYADNIIRKIHQGVTAQSEKDPQQAHDIMANQIRATSYSVEKHVGDNELARTYLQCMQVRAKKHAKKQHPHNCKHAS